MQVVVIEYNQEWSSMYNKEDKRNTWRRINRNSSYCSSLLS